MSKASRGSKRTLPPNLIPVSKFGMNDSNLLDGLDSDRFGRRSRSSQKPDPNQGFESLYQRHIASKIDQSEYGKRKIRQLNKEINELKKIFNQEQSKVKKSECVVQKLHE